MIIQKIESKIKLNIIVSIIAILSGCIVGICGIYFGSLKMSQASNDVYIIKDDIPYLAHKSDRASSYQIEAKSMIKTFHKLFFTLPPDDRYIEHTLHEALYLIDESGLKQKNALMDKGFYNDILSYSANFTIICDSIIIDPNRSTFTYYGTQRIEKRNTISRRQLITTGALQEVTRSFNNPFGYIITNYKTISNTDLSIQPKF